MNILLTGAGGQLGQDLAGVLKMDGHSLISLDSRSLDITGKAKVFKAVNDARPEIIINCAAYTKVDLAEKERERAFTVNRDGAGNIAEAASSAGALLVHISTDFVFDGSKGAPYVETDSPRPISVYGESKLAGEEEVVKRHSHHIIVRTSWLYGAHGNNFVKTILRLGAEREALRVVYDQVGTPTWTVDLGSALSKIIKSIEDGGRISFGVYHYSNEGVASWYDFAESIIEESRELGVPLLVKTVTPILTSGYPTPAQRPAYSVLNKDKIKEAFGITIPHWRASLKKMLSCLQGGE